MAETTEHPVSALKLHHVSTGKPVQAIKALRAVSHGGLRWAKMDVYDRVAAGHVVSIPVDSIDAIATLEAAGWTASIDTEAILTFTVAIPAGKCADIKAIVHALGGRCDV